MKTFWLIPILDYWTPKEGILKKSMKFNCLTKNESELLDKKVKTEKNINTNQELIIKRNKDLISNKKLKNKKKQEYTLEILPFKHQENGYYDYEKERLIPERLSYEGPTGLSADFNGDGLNDLFLGGARYQSPKIYLGSENLKFNLVETPDFATDSKYEDVDAATIDIDNDGDLDIYVVSGGNDLMESDKNLMDRIYINAVSYTHLTLPTILLV